MHFFEPRYRLLIAEVMAREPPHHRAGVPIVPSSRRNFPRFIYANHTPLAPRSPACIVQVRQCRIYENSTADVLLVPIAHVWLERISVRPNTGGLYEATVIRMGGGASRAVENNVRREHVHRDDDLDEGVVEDPIAGGRLGPVIRAILQTLRSVRRNQQVPRDNNDDSINDDNDEDNFDDDENGDDNSNGDEEQEEGVGDDDEDENGDDDNNDDDNSNDDEEQEEGGDNDEEYF